jgi:hypothetical protein
MEVGVLVAQDLPQVYQGLEAEEQQVLVQAHLMEEMGPQILAAEAAALEGK